ncbi:hypothetical protein Q0F98_18800 [Paenibacillus amylolyticus]|nr:hypothetical protein Q0F98_18800 [Paenibacillus amylolyticus]
MSCCLYRIMMINLKQQRWAAEGYVAFKQKKDKGEQHAKNTFLVMEALSGAKAGNSANELALPFVRQSQVELFKGKELGQPDNLAAAKVMAENILDAGCTGTGYRQSIPAKTIQGTGCEAKHPGAVLGRKITRADRRRLQEQRPADVWTITRTIKHNAKPH